MEEQETKKICSTCKIEKSLQDFHVHLKTKDGRQYICIDCKRFEDTKRREKRSVNKKKYVEKNRESPYHIKLWLLKGARSRAKALNREYRLTIDDLPELPVYCPVFPHIKLASNAGNHKDNSYSLDRINSNEGYIPGNIQIISFRANALKSDRTLEEQEMLLRYMRDQRRIRQEQYLKQIEEMEETCPQQEEKKEGRGST